MPSERCINCGRRVPWISFWGNLAITMYKISVGLLGGSSALIADGIHSFTDVIGTSAILFSRRISDRPADSSHPYGHGKAEFLGSIFIYTVLLFLSGAIFFGGLLMIINGHYTKPRIVTMLAAGVSVFYNVLMYRLGQCAGKKNNSPALLANSFENRADAISSVACIVGIAAAVFIHPICDPIAAMLVGVVIFVNCIIQLKESYTGLMDSSLSIQAVHRIRQLALQNRDVADVEFVKTRQTGTKYWVDLGIRVSRDLLVTRADEIASEIRTEMMRRSERFHSVEVFVSPAPNLPGKRSSIFSRKKKMVAAVPAE
ncbi:MAG: cation transporter [Deltaproteobacteria bacterium]|nr:cation transporter [Deltaproteobacteria bacterium]